MNDRGNRVKEGEILLTAKRANQFSQWRRGEGAGGNDHIIPLCGNLVDLLAGDRHQRIGCQQFADMFCKTITVNSKCATCRYFVKISRAHYQRINLAHFLMQNADSVAGRIIRAKRVRADKFSKVFSVMRVGHAHRTHFMQNHRHIA